MKSIRVRLIAMLVLAMLAAIFTSPLVVAQEQPAPPSIIQTLIQAKENELIQLAAQREQQRETIRALETLEGEAGRNLETARLTQKAAVEDKRISSTEFGEYLATTSSAENTLRAVTNRLKTTIKDLEETLTAEREEERALGRLRIRQEAERIQQALGK